MPARVQKGPRMETSARHTPKARTCDRICRSARTQSCHKTKVVSQDKVGTIVLLWLSYFAVFAIPVLLQGYLSWKGQFLTPSQMQQQGVAIGLPFIAHTAMWSDASLLAALMATIIYLYGHQWDSGQFCIALGIGIIGSALMHWGFYVNSFFEPGGYSVFPSSSSCFTLTRLKKYFMAISSSRASGKRSRPDSSPILNNWKR
jgi:hypothetical protein